MILKHDCRYFSGDRPCKFHKAEGIVCSDCPHFSPKGKMILIIKLDAIGDVLRTTSLLHSLKEANPGSYVSWLTKSNASDMFRNNHLVDEVLIYESGNLNAVLSIIEYDVIINLDPSPVSSSLASFAKGKTKIGFGLDLKGNVYPFNKQAEEWFEMGAFDNLKAKNTKTYQQIIHEICSLPYSKGKIIFNITEDESLFAKEFYDKNSLSKYKKIIGINAGASNRWQFKKWRLEGYAELIKALHKKYNCAFLLFGSKNEKDINDYLSKECKNVFDTGSENSLREFASYINLCDVLVTGDTLALHVATALEVPSVCIFGPTSHTEIEDYGLVRKIYPNMDCLVCYKNKCDFKPNCMELVTTDMVFNEVVNILEN
ncbi:MAG: glycosyltransferase family 9 protein [Ignavibacteria bacterium]